MKAEPVVLTMWERVGVRGRGAGCGVDGVGRVYKVRWCEVGRKYCIHSEYTACSTRFDEVFRVCANITHPPHRGRCVMSTTSIVHTSDCLYMHILYMQECTKRGKYTYYI